MTEQEIHLWFDELKASDFLETIDTLSERGIYVANPSEAQFFYEGIELSATIYDDEFVLPIDPVVVATKIKDLYGVSVMVPGRVENETKNEDRE